MEAGGKDRLPMLAPGNYVQWKSKIKRYIDTKPNHELIHYCLKNPPYKFTWADKEVLISKGSFVTTTETYMETYKNVLQDIGDQLNAEAEVVQIILTGIDNDIYSTVDACPNAFNEIRAERIARTANPLALVAQQQPLYHPHNHSTHYTQNSLTRSQQAATRNRGKAIVNSPQPIYDQEPSMIAEDDDMSKDKEIDKLIEDQELEAHYMYKAQIQEVSPDAADSGPIFDSEPVQKNVIIDSLDMSYDREQIDQNDDDDDLANEQRSRLSHTHVNNGNSKESFNKQTTLLEKRIDESIPWDQKCKSSKELFKIKRSVGTIFDGVECCKETIAKRTYFGHIDPFIQNTIEANFSPEIRKFNVDLEKFRVCLKEEMVADLRYFNSLELEVDSLKSQLET
nr:hypothetical protein [Tanacetum cinerariifolium]